MGWEGRRGRLVERWTGRKLPDERGAGGEGPYIKVPLIREREGQNRRETMGRLTTPLYKKQSTGGEDHMKGGEGRVISGRSPGKFVQNVRIGKKEEKLWRTGEIPPQRAQHLF